LAIGGQVIAYEDTKKNVISWVTTSTPLELPTTWVDLEQGLAKCCSDIEATEDVLRAVKAYAPKPNQRVVAVRSDYDGFHARLASATSRQGDLSTEMCLAIASHNLRPLVHSSRQTSRRCLTCLRRPKMFRKEPDRSSDVSRNSSRSSQVRPGRSSTQLAKRKSKSSRSAAISRTRS
jgi:hypothetical protein